MKTIAPTQLHQLLTAQPDLALLDVRTPVEYAEVHVPQTSNVPLDSLAPKELFDSGHLSKGQPVYILCRTGERSKKAAEICKGGILSGGGGGGRHAGVGRCRFAC
jgi:rhodanese-related sulfurtransferase